MMNFSQGPWRVQDELIEQPSWGGRYILDLKGLSDAPEWQGKKVGQSYEFSRESRLIDPATGAVRPLAELIAEDAVALLGQKVVDKFGVDLSLLIKLTQAKGNSFQVHLPAGASRGEWVPKPEAWFYLAPGLYTFGLKESASFEAYARVLRSLDEEMRRLSHEVTSGRLSLDEARAQAHRRIQTLDPYAYVNQVEAEADDIVDLTAGGIHHSWEEDDARFPDGNLVYEVQVDVPDDRCSMRGFDKGKFLSNGDVRPTHVEDYLAALDRSPGHNDPSCHVRKPHVLRQEAAATLESIFRTPYFHMDRIGIQAGAQRQSLADGFHHLFLLRGTAWVAGMPLRQGCSCLLPSRIGDYTIESTGGAVLLRTYLPV
ncbi:MAG: hypothetical protein ACLQVD_20490 [Capsulimonadaceae bacterium]